MDLNTILQLRRAHLAAAAALGDTTQVFADEFQGDADVSLESHTPNVGGSWVTQQGGWTLDGSGHVRLVSGGQDDWGNAIVTDSGVSDGIIHLTVSSFGGAGHYPGIAFRVENHDSLFNFHLRSDSCTAQLVERTAGVETSRGTYGNGAVAGQDYELTVELRGPEIRCYVNDVLAIICQSDVRQTATKHGLGQYGSEQSLFDEFSVRP